VIESRFNHLFLCYEKYKKRCWACGNLDSIKWGRQANNQRYKCKNCGIFFTAENESVSRKNLLVWFKRWVVYKHTFEQLSKESGYSISTLQRYFYVQLDGSPIWQTKQNEPVNLLIDGTYFGNDLCLVIYRDNRIKFTQLYRLTDGEWYEEIREDLTNILDLGVDIQSITCDGHKAILRAIRLACPEVTTQRCLFHIQNMCKIWLTSRPKNLAAKELRAIVGQLHLVKTHNDKLFWIRQLKQWYFQHREFVQQKTHNQQSKRWWYTHKLLRRSYTVVKNALPDMFHYLDNTNIPKTTNGLESFFGHLKDNLSIHRGLSKPHKRNFIRWYLYFKNTDVF
jgi:transposase-like protein